jgi:arylsulfatase A-like enzyme
MKPVGTQNLQLFVNGKSLPILRMPQGNAFSVFEVPLPENVLEAGENQLLLRFGGTRPVAGEDVAVALDYLQLAPPSPAAGAPTVAPAEQPSALPLFGQLVQEVVVASTKRRAIVQRAPATLGIYVEVPDKASLSFRVGQVEGQGATARVEVQAEGEPGKPVFERKLSADWQEEVISLAGFANKIVRVELAAEGPGSVAWASPSILVPKAELSAAPPVKSVIVLLVDTLRADKLRAYDPKSPVQTPVLDRFAKEGTLFVNAQSPENWTKPSVASIFTGLYPMTHRTKESDSKLPDAVLTVSEVYKQNGFSTATFLANGYVSDKFGFAQGWDHYTNYIRENKSTQAENVFKEAGDWIEKHKDERFYVYIQTIDPHVPYDPPKRLLELYDPEPYGGVISPRKTPDLLEKAKRNPPAVTFNERDRQHLEALYDAEVTYHDEEMGKFVERLTGLGLYDQVLFAVTSDHGEEFYEHGSYGHGHSVYQELVHVPMIFRRPGLVPAGQRIEHTVGTLDIAPTILTATGLAVPDVMEAQDRMAHIRGEQPAKPAVAFSDFLDDRRAIRAGRYKLILSGINATFFDLEADPGEKRELDARSHPIARRYCRILLGQFLGAKNLRDWLSAEQKADAPRFERENTAIDEKTREGLKALGYAN